MKQGDNDSWVFYIIVNRGATYAGVSPDPERRLRKHNGELSGGAKYTRSKGPGWKHVCLVSGFQTKIQALQFEWAVKHCAPKNVGGINSRIKKLYEVLKRDKWTSRSPLSCDVPLVLKWVDMVDLGIDIGIDICKEGGLPDWITVEG